MIRTLFILACTLLLTACAGSYRFVDYRDRDYDPVGGVTLLDQIPNWDPKLTAHARNRDDSAR